MLMESIGEDFVPLCPADGVCDKYAQVLLLLRGFLTALYILLDIILVGLIRMFSMALYVFCGTVHIGG